MSAAGGSITGTVTSVDESGQAAQLGAQPPPARSRNELQNARSAVFRIMPDGGTDVLWSSPTVTAFAVAASPQGGVLVGTSDKGRIYSVTDDGRDTLLVQSSEDQISSFVVRGRDVFAASSNQGKLFRFAGDPVGEGTYESPVRDARFVASWGRIRWRGRGAVELQTRTGNTERPDMTWSEWSAPYRDAGGRGHLKPARALHPVARGLEERGRAAKRARRRRERRLPAAQRGARDSERAGVARRHLAAARRADSG